MIKAEPRPTGGRKTIRDIGADGLEIVFHASGKVSWRVGYPAPDGTYPRPVIGHFPQMLPAQARAVALQIRAAGERGQHPQKERQEAKKQAKTDRVETVAALADKWLKEGCSGVRPPTLKNREGIVRNHIKPLLGSRPYRKLEKTEVVAAMDSIVASGKTETARSFIETGSAMFNWASERISGLGNPFSGIQSLPTKVKRTRIGQEEEIRRVWAALDERDTKEPDGLMTSTAMRLAILMPLRRAEICGVRLSDINFQERYVTLWAERTKEEVYSLVPLTDWTLEIINGLIAKHDPQKPNLKGALFVGIDGEPLDPARVTKAWVRLRKRLGISDLRLHDSRRTLATGMGDSGVDADKISLALTHKPKNVPAATLIYLRSAYLKQRREAFEAWERKLAKIIGRPLPQTTAHPRRRVATLPRRLLGKMAVSGD